LLICSLSDTLAVASAFRSRFLITWRKVTMAILFQILSVIVSLVSLGCFIMVVVQMFQHGQTGMGIACIVLIFCCGIGGIVAFVYGWMKANEWNIKNLMLAWTAAIIVGFLINAVGAATGAIDFRAIQNPNAAAN
jgi:hypothetical protein